MSESVGILLYAPNTADLGGSWYFFCNKCCTRYSYLTKDYKYWFVFPEQFGNYSQKCFMNDCKFYMAKGKFETWLLGDNIRGSWGVSDLPNPDQLMEGYNEDSIHSGDISGT